MKRKVGFQLGSAYLVFAFIVVLQAKILTVPSQNTSAAAVAVGSWHFKGLMLNILL